MSVFAVLLPTPQPSLATRIEKEYTGSYLKLSDTQYLVSSRGTAIEVSARLLINSAGVLADNAIVFAISSYWGRAPTAVWDWIKARMESP